MTFKLKHINPILSELAMQEAYFWYGCFYSIVPIANFTSNKMIESFIKNYK